MLQKIKIKIPNYKLFENKINIGHPDKNINILKESYKKIHKNIQNLPKNIDFVLLSPWGDKSNSLDELCHISESLDLIISAKRGRLIIDKNQRGNIKHGKLAHDLDNLKPDQFVNITKGNLEGCEVITIVN